MTSDQAIEVFQDLTFYVPEASREAFREALIAQADGGWSHNTDSEKKITQVFGSDEDVIVFTRTADENVDAVSLFLFSCDEGYRVTNIVPLEQHELGQRRYNIALVNFIQQVGEPVVSKFGFSTDLTSSEQSLDDWMSETTASALRSFSALANKGTGSSHPLDRKRWFKFLISLHNDHGNFDTDRLARWLIEVEGWGEDAARDLVGECDFALQILNAYDQIGE